MKYKNRTPLLSLLRLVFLPLIFFSFWLSFGSIAFAAIVTALIKTARYFFKKWKKSKNPCVRACGLLCFASLQRFFQFFNSVALSFVMLFDKPYLRACRSSAALLANKSAALDMVVSNSLLDDVVGMGTVLCAVLCGTLASVLCFAHFDLPFVVSTIVIVAAIFIGYCVMYPIYCALDAAVSSLFVLIILEPATFAANHAELRAKLYAARPAFFDGKQRHKGKRSRRESDVATAAAAVAGGGGGGAVASESHSKRSRHHSNRSRRNTNREGTE